MNLFALVRDRESHDRKAKRNDSGKALTALALMLLVLCGVVGLAIDVANLYHLKGRMQTVTDAQATAAVQELNRRSGDSRVEQAGLSHAALSGFNGGEGVTVNHPPMSGSEAGDENFVEVLIRQETPTTFMRILGINSTTIQIRAVGALIDSAPDDLTAVLDPIEENEGGVNGGANISSCTIIFDSSDLGAASPANSGANVSWVTENGIRIRRQTGDLRLVWRRPLDL